MKEFLVGIVKIAIVAVSFYFLLTIFLTNISNIKLSVDYIGFFSLLMFSILYSFLLGFIAWVWTSIVEKISKRKYSTKIILIYLKTFIAKYIPGNVFHYVSRQIEMSKEGISHKVLIKGNMIETLYLIFSSIIVMLVLLSIDKTLFDIHLEKYLNKTYLNIIVIFLLLCILAMKNSDYMVYMMYYCIFFVGLGGITYYVAHSVLKYDISIFFSIFIFTVSWLIGTLSPGAPGGIGVRESIFIVLSDNILLEYQALLLAVLLRLVTIGGEFIAYLYAIYKIKEISEGVTFK